MVSHQYTLPNTNRVCLLFQIVLNMVDGKFVELRTSTLANLVINL